VLNANKSQMMGNVDADGLQARIDALGREMSGAFQRLFDAIPGAPHRPTALAQRTGLSRVTISRLLNAIARPAPNEVLEQVPGPESLRALVRAAAGLGVTDPLIDETNRVIDTFAGLIRRDFGTRSAFNAAITPQHPELKTRFTNASRYQVYMGMRQILGVEADTWLTCMFFAPGQVDPDALAVTTIHGALGMRRLRPDANVYFTFGPPGQAAGANPPIAPVTVDLREFCANDPAPLESRIAAGQVVHRLTHDRLGRLSTVDMLAVSHNAKGSRRYGTPERPRGGVVVFPDVPVKTLICDAIIHDDVFPGSHPELIVYNPGAHGPANPCDPSRDIDRVEVVERIETLGKNEDRFKIAEVPHYAGMVDRVCREIGHAPSNFSAFRLRMAYPVHGFQFVMAFDAPPKPA
jgi:hypothetical protein